MSEIEPTPENRLFDEIRELIDAAKQRVAVTVNAELTLLYWQIGHRIYTQILNQDRATYGKQVIHTLAQQLTQTYGKGWSKRHLWQCVQFAETFPNFEIVSTLGRQLSWTHIKTLIYVDDPLKRDFYIELAQLENWSVRQLKERINNKLLLMLINIKEIAT